jgi:hypothetical protein
MLKYNLKDFKGGWFCGNFEPSLIKTAYFEVAIKRYNKGDVERCHYHKIAIEYTVIIDGEVLMNGKQYGTNDIIIIDRMESTDFICLTDVVTCVVKIPSIVDDKYIVKDDSDIT